ncbi:alpha-galactosidase [Clostridiales bacterium COT073_COT-073]|nr:alpha-galactosidase [Clostridiales bacterium COT073_COT-073]
MIFFHPNNKQFHLSNEKISYIFKVMENGELCNLYYGKAMKDRENFDHLQSYYERPLTPNSASLSMLSLQYTRQEYPSYGTGDFRFPAFRILQEKGSLISNFVYESHQIFSGKKDILPLPSTYVEKEQEAETIEITLFDQVTQTRLLLSYTIFAYLPVITRHAVFTQVGAATISLKNAMSLCLDLPDMEWEMLHFAGTWGRERYLKKRSLEVGIQSISSMRGSSSAEHNPSFLIKRPHTTEFAGEAIGFSFVYSGSFLGQIEVSPYEETRILLGIHPENFDWQLKQGESFTTPEGILVYSDNGLNAMSQTFHQLFRTHLNRSQWRDKPRPILLNNWEATEMTFDEELILKIAAKAKEAGAELFVLDDGWFGTRNDDTQGLGDWFVNTEKLPSGIDGLSKKITDMGIAFGLWIEPEMINKNSKLYETHPDWLMVDPAREPSPSRHQFILDYSRPEVVDGIYQMLEKVISGSDISYIKWDMNRYTTETYSNHTPAEEQGKVLHRYVLGVYDLYTRLTARFPHILFESCSSGGARFDPGMLSFAPQTWCSDNSDAVDRYRIQYGTSYFYPISSIGAHVSAVPNHQTGRISPLATRANVAYYGAFGYELDLNHLTDKEFEEVKAQIAFYKKSREVFQFGTFYRLLSPFENHGSAAWISVSEDKSIAYAGYYQTLERVNHGSIRLYLAGLCPKKQYHVTSYSYDHIHYGDELMNAGLVIDRRILSRLGGDFTSLLFEIKEI